MYIIVYKTKWQFYKRSTEYCCVNSQEEVLISVWLIKENFLKEAEFEEWLGRWNSFIQRWKQGYFKQREHCIKVQVKVYYIHGNNGYLHWARKVLILNPALGSWGAMKLLLWSPNHWQTAKIMKNILNTCTLTFKIYKCFWFIPYKFKTLLNS